ncbi:MAG: phosphogluconate dehydrogenase (NAD(+)-dependent, decarboxylating) [Patescibacteria group bacterium]
MIIGFIGLGRMGNAMARRLLRHGVGVIAYNRSSDPYPSLKQAGAVIVQSAREVASSLKGRKIIWLMVPQGKPVDELISEMVGAYSNTPLSALTRGDIIIDGGNSNYLDSRRRARGLKRKGIYFLDIGTSGGITGEKDGWCFMVGGEKKAYRVIEPMLKIMSHPRGGYLYCGPTGAGHLVKTVHNGIEVGMMEAIAEGLAVLQTSRFKLRLADIADVWTKKSIIDSRLIAWARDALRNPQFTRVAPYVEGGTTGKWTVEEANRRGVHVPAIIASLRERVRSRKGKGSFAHKVVAALRQEFGGHSVKILNSRIGISKR